MYEGTEYLRWSGPRREECVFDVDIRGIDYIPHGKVRLHERCGRYVDEAMFPRDSQSPRKVSSEVSKKECQSIA